MEFIPLPSAAAAAAFFLFSFLFTSSFHFHTLHAQQTYLNNKQLACENNLTQTLGNVCNGVNTSCTSYLTFRSDSPLYDSAVLIAYLLGADSKTIASINKITDVEKISNNKLVMVPVTCSCLGDFYQHNASYTLKTQGETYFTVSNNTYQGLTTCQAMMNQNPYDYRNLFAGMSLSVPLRCACPTQAQVSNGYKYLLTYLPDWKDDVSQMAERFKVDEQTLLDANKKSVDDDVIFPFTPFLIPLKTEPTTAFTVTLSPPPVEPPPRTTTFAVTLSGEVPYVVASSVEAPPPTTRYVVAPPMEAPPGPTGFAPTVEAPPGPPGPTGFTPTVEAPPGPPGPTSYVVAPPVEALLPTTFLLLIV